MVREMVRAARLHEPGKPMQIDRVEKPSLRPEDVLIEVRACGVIPNMNAIFSGALWNHLPPLPASIGLDTAGVVVEVGADARGVSVGERVYINPWLACGTCHYCVVGEPMLCANWAFQGYFGYVPESRRMMQRYPFGGFSDYVTAAPARLVKLPDQVTFEQAARFGYLGTSFAGLRAGGTGVGKTLMINGITGTLGVGATLLALAMGVTRILGFGRNTDVMAQLRALSPGRIETLVLGTEPIADWVRTRTDGLGADILLDCSGRAASSSYTLEAIDALRHGGVAVNIGALTEALPLNPFHFMNRATSFRGSNWFSTGEGQIMADMAGAGILDLSPLVPQRYPLEGVNEALTAIKARPGGLTNIVVCPQLAN